MCIAHFRSIENEIINLRPLHEMPYFHKKLENRITSAQAAGGCFLFFA